ncbi:NUDIX hydrolase [Candidatus Falkowbacteria bacterium CG_4_8_14_3_um_filter_36_11]|nr:MAG: NUDIX hydrolase [Candidatus Falkowbacteria bacterium CG_4_8_14_3_um_filter_36_11]
MGVGALIMNAKDEILIVKPAYKDHWSIAGGVVEENESPKTACLREVKEEIGIDLKNVKFLCVDYTANKGEKGESLQFIFFGGKLSESEIIKIRLDKKEIAEFRFIKIRDSLPLLSERLKMRLPKCLDALTNNIAIYLEGGG